MEWAAWVEWASRPAILSLRGALILDSVLVIRSTDFGRKKGLAFGLKVGRLALLCNMMRRQDQRSIADFVADVIDEVIVVARVC